MRIYVELSTGLDVGRWREQHAFGRVPDATPYGLHRLERDGDLVRFRRNALTTDKGLHRRIRARTWNWEFAEEACALADPLRRSADVVLCMDERTGGPAVLAPSRVPVVTGVGWLEHRTDLGSVHAALAGRVLQGAQAVFTQSPALVPTLVSEFGLARERVHAVRLGIDTDHFRALAWPEGRPTVFSVGDDRMRDHATLVKAMHEVRAVVPEAFLSLATTLPVDVPEDLGVVHARRMDAAVREQYARAQVVAVALKPTRQGSGLTVLLEAMASARPIVITANPGLERYLEHGVTGLLVPPGDPSAMAKAIADLLSDPQRAAEMGRAARRSVVENFDSAAMADDLHEVLKTAIGA